jgi:hypothetical protein
MELRAAVGAYDEIAAQFTVYTSAGGGVSRPSPKPGCTERSRRFLPFASSRPGPQGFDLKAAIPACAPGD